MYIIGGLLLVLTVAHPYKRHIPVLFRDSITTLVTNRSGRYIDGTFGSGGHAKGILSLLDEQGRLVAVDRDPEAVDWGKNTFKNTLLILLGNFGMLESLLSAHSQPTIGYSGIMLDLGASTHQLDEPTRGFSYLRNGMLDMRMSNPLFDPNCKSCQISDVKITNPPVHTALSCNTAFHIVNSWSEERLSNLFQEFGEEPRAASIARAIVQYRKDKPITTTHQLCSVICHFRQSVHKKIVTNESTAEMHVDNKIFGIGNYPMLSRIFQALRMAVNDELRFLELFLANSPRLVGVGGRIVVISYHSLEDRLVKHAFRDLMAGDQFVESGLKGSPAGIWKLVTKKCIMPNASELASNPRCRSARMRCIERVA